MRRLTTLSLASIAVCASARAQNHVLVVSPTGPYTQIQAAVDAASDRDTVLVKSGTYGGFLIADKGVSVVADTGASVIVTGTMAVTGLASTRDVVLLGLQSSLAYGYPQEALLIQDDVGSVRVERCDIRGAQGPTGTDGARIDNSGDVVLLHSSVRGGGSSVHVGAAGVRMSGSNVAIYDGLVLGGWGGDYSCGCQAAPGGFGMGALGGFLFASRTHFEGGAGGAANTGCIGCSCGADGGDGGWALGLSAGAVAKLLDDSFLGGVGGPQDCGVCGGCGGSQGQPGGTIFGPGATLIPGAGRELQAASPARELVPVTLQIQGRPGDRVWLFDSRDTGFRCVPGYKGVQIPKLPSPPTFLGTIGASGSLTATYTVPELGLGKETRNYYLQTAHQDTAGAWTFGSAVDLVGLDAAF